MSASTLAAAAPSVVPTVGPSLVPPVAPTVAPPGTTTTVAPGVHAFVQPDGGWCLSNAGIVVGSRRVVLVDTAATEARTRTLLAAVARLAPGRSLVAVNTHFHGDHTLGNSLLPEGSALLGHPLARERMATTGLDLTRLWPQVRWGDVSVRLPDVTVEAGTVLHTGPGPDDPEVHLAHPGPAHTDNDLYAWLPQERVLFTGDLVMADVTPFLVFGSVLGSRDAVPRLAALRPAVVVPGHGPVGGPELLTRTAEYLDRLLACARAGLRDGLTPLAAAARFDTGPFRDWLDPERTVANLHRAYADLGGQPPAAPLDLDLVMADMYRHAGPHGTVCRA